MRGRRALQLMGGQSRGDVCASMALLRGIECGNAAEPRRVALLGMWRCSAISRTSTSSNFEQLTNEIAVHWSALL